MKVWYGFGAEHSSNLVLIGHFVSSGDAQVAAQEILKIVDVVQREFDYEEFDDDPMSVFTIEPLVEVLKELNLHSVSGEELEQLNRQSSVQAEGSRVVIRTEELDIGGFLKFLIGKGAHVEVYSLHDFPDGPPDDTEC